MHGNHPYGTLHKSDLTHNKTMAGPWRTRDGLTHKVTVRRIAPALTVPA